MLDAKTSLNITMNTDAIEDTRTQEQKDMLNTSKKAGTALEFIIAKGDKGFLRPELTDAEYAKRTRKRNAAKASRKANR